MIVCLLCNGRDDRHNDGCPKLEGRGLTHLGPYTRRWLRDQIQEDLRRAECSREDDHRLIKEYLNRHYTLPKRERKACRWDLTARNRRFYSIRTAMKIARLKAALKECE